MPYLSIEDLTVHFPVRRGWLRKSRDVVHAVDHVSLEIGRGETMALVGESGSGKTTVAESILQLTRPTTGVIQIGDCDLRSPGRGGIKAVRGKVQIVFQDPYSSLSPRMTVRDIVAEPLLTHRRMTGKELNERVVSLLEMVGLDTQHLWRRPHEFSGGQCQRVALARALALDPELVILDEPTSALDVSVQARILLLLDELKARLGLAYLLVSHDLAVVESLADRVAVMYLGEIVEVGPGEEILHRPRHPYTAALLASVPSPDPETRGCLSVLEGDVPSAIHPPPGCRFHPRCRYRMDICRTVKPDMVEVAGGGKRACHLPVETLFPCVTHDTALPEPH